MGNAMRLAVERCDDDELGVILEAADAVIRAAGEEAALPLFEAIVTLFERVVLATGNSVFVGVMREAALAMRRNLRDWHPFVALPLSRAEEYARIRECIAARDADGAERLLREQHGLV